jgi:Matrixin
MRAAIFVLILILLAVLFSGCASLKDPMLGKYAYTHLPSYTGLPVRTIPIWIDKNFGAADRLEIDNAINAWNYAMNGYVKLEVMDTQFDMEIPKIVLQVKTNGWLFLRIHSDNALVPDRKDGFWTVGFTERIGGNHLYLVRDRLANEDMFGVTLHEIGHLMGSDHVGQRLMYPHYSRARFQCIDYDTMARVADFFVLKLDNLNYCVDKDPSQAGDMKIPESGPVMADCPVKD